MQPATAPRPAAPPAQAQAIDPSALLEQILERQPTERYRTLSTALDKRVERVEEVLPPQMKGQGQRLVRRAMMTFARRPELEACPPAEFIRCVIEAAECGLAIDGKLAYVVKYKTAWQLQIDYKGLKAVAVRSGQILDSWARLVHRADRFRAWESDGECHLEHEQPQGFATRGDVVGVYAIVALPPPGKWRYELMSLEDVNRIRGRSSAAKAGKGPWFTDEGEMQKKTALRRALKMYCDDPAFVRAAQIDDDDYEPERSVTALGLAPASTESSLLADRLGLNAPAGNGAGTVAPPQPPADEPQDLLTDAAPPREDLDADDVADELFRGFEAAATIEDLDAVRRRMFDAEGLLGPQRFGRLESAEGTKRRALRGKMSRSRLPITE